MRFFQRNRIPNQRGQACAIAQHEKKQIQHHPETDHKPQCVLSDFYRLACHQLAGICRHGRQFLLNFACRGQVNSLQKVAQPPRHAVVDVLKISPEIELPRCNTVVDGNGFIRHGRANHNQRQDDDQQAQRQRDEGCQIRAAWHALQQSLVERVKQNRQCQAPENGANKGPQNPAKTNADGNQQK